MPLRLYVCTRVFLNNTVMYETDVDSLATLDLERCQMFKEMRDTAFVLWYDVLDMSMPSTIRSHN